MNALTVWSATYVPEPSCPCRRASRQTSNARDTAAETSVEEACPDDFCPSVNKF
jgi:hypothetical protein